MLLLAGACAGPADRGDETSSGPDQVSDAPPSTPTENGVDGWTALAGGSVRLAVDDERNGAIELASGGEYRFTKMIDGATNPDGNVFVSWDFRSADAWTIEIDVTTAEGPRTLRYEPKDVTELGQLNDDRWHSISRDLTEDLRNAQPNAKLVSVDGLRIHGSGRIDSIKRERAAVAVPDTTDFETIAATSGALAAGRIHSCGMLSGGVKCWGGNNAGQLGNNLTTNSAFPVQVSGLTIGATAIAAYGDRTCAVVSGAAKCWGTGTNKIPTQIAGLTTGVTAIAVGNLHTCALVSGGVKCWTTAAPTPTAVSGLTSGVTAISAGRDFTCAMTSTGAAKCWGTNTYGQLGNSTVTSSTVPVQVSGLTTGVLGIAAGDNHVCARISTGVRCWGLNTSGQLGNNTVVNSKIPVVASGLAATTHLTGGGNHTCAIASNGALKCWGSNSYGQLGDNTTVNKLVPVQVSTLTGGGSAVSAGNLHTCARIVNATRCWGYGVYGQLGSGFYTSSSVQVETAVPFAAVGQITQPGSYVLTTNLTTGLNPAIFIHDTSNVTLNCNNRTVASNDNAEELIKVDNVTNVTVTNCVSKTCRAFVARASPKPLPRTNRSSSRSTTWPMRPLQH